MSDYRYKAFAAISCKSSHNYEYLCNFHCFNNIFMKNYMTKYTNVCTSSATYNMISTY